MIVNFRLACWHEADIAVHIHVHIDIQICFGTWRKYGNDSIVNRAQRGRSEFESSSSIRRSEHTSNGRLKQTGHTNQHLGTTRYIRRSVAKQFNRHNPFHTSHTLLSNELEFVSPNSFQSTSFTHLNISMCTITIKRHTNCPASHNTSTVKTLHEEAIYCAYLFIEEIYVDGFCRGCTMEFKRGREKGSKIECARDRVVNDNDDRGAKESLEGALDDDTSEELGDEGEIGHAHGDTNRGIDESLNKAVEIGTSLIRSNALLLDLSKTGTDISVVGVHTTGISAVVSLQQE